MGGCRCCFRDCKVNTYKQNRMHFFRFPLKKLERFKKWREYAQTEEMLSFSEVKKTNMVVCGRHFRPECFMNYKMDRLTPNAIPTLMRLSKTQALDFEQDVDNGVLITLEEPKQKHLIPPKDFECCLDLDVDEDLVDRLKELENNETAAETDVDGQEDLREYEPIRADPLQDSYSILQVETEDVEYDAVRDIESVTEPPARSSSNTVEILETMQVSAPHYKRPRTQVEEPVGICKKRIHNTKDNVDAPIKTLHTIIVPCTTQSQPKLDCVVEVDNNLTTFDQSELVDEDGNPIFMRDVYGDDDDSNAEYFEIRNEAELEDDFEANANNATIIQLKSDNHQENLTVLELLTAQEEITALNKRNTEAEVLKVKISKLEKDNLKLKDTLEKNEDLKSQLLSCHMENSRMKNCIKDLEIFKAKLQQSNKGCEMSYIGLNLKEKKLKEKLELEFNDERKKHLQTETKLLQQISTLKESLELSQKQIATRNDLSLHESNINDLQLENQNLNKQILEIEQSLQSLQNNYDTLNQEHTNLNENYDCLQKKYTKLEQKCWKLEALNNQVSTVTTSLENIPDPCPPSQVSQPSTISLTKAQLFNAIKRYLSASMVSLLRMEMFGSSERAWKSDERQVAVDLLRLGETVYKYLIDEWRFRLPALRDVRNWLSQSVAMDDEEDL